MSQPRDLIFTRAWNLVPISVSGSLELQAFGHLKEDINALKGACQNFIEILQKDVFHKLFSYENEIFNNAVIDTPFT